MDLLLASLALTTPSLSAYEADQQHPISAPQPLGPQLSIPLLGFGTWNLDRANASDAVAVALQTGYRHVDCAAAYGNEKEVGRGIEEGMKLAGVGRGEVWVTSKLWNDRHAPDMVEEALDQTLEDLGLDYLDLYLMHWPVASSSGGDEIDYLDTWQAMTTLLSTPKVRQLGICNFSPPQLTQLLSSTSTPPSVHQMELHPYLPQPDWLLYHASRAIHITAYSPLANSNPIYHPSPSSSSSSSYISSPDHDLHPPPLLLENQVMTTIADRRNCTPAQVSLAWGLSRSTSVIPKSAHAERIGENFAAGGCRLEYEDFKAMARMGREWETRFNNPSEGWGVELFEGLDGV